MMNLFRKKFKETKIEDRNLETKTIEAETTSTIIQNPQPNQTTYSGFCYNIKDCPANELCLKQQNDCLYENAKIALQNWSGQIEKERKKDQN